METKLMFIHALSPLHAGTGQGVGVIDQPIAREKATDIPFLPGSTLKGVFRDACADADRENIFGPGVGSEELFQGAVTFTDARLLLLPVRSLRGVFAWVTSPLLLNRFTRDARDVKDGLGDLPQQSPSLSEDEECLVSGSVLTMNDKVVLEDLELDSNNSPEVTAWAGWLAEALFPNEPEWQKSLRDRLCIVSDDTLAFLLETATEVTARIRLEENKKTVAQGALWYEEALPVESVLISMVIATVTSKVAQLEKIFKTVESLSQKTLQFGGNATVGRGLCRAMLLGV